MKDPIDFPGPLSRDLDELEAFDAMRLFLEAYWERGLKTSDDLAVLLGSLDRAAKDGGPMDAAQWDDWLQAIRKAKAAKD
jgi:hypothetical protein